MKSTAARAASLMTAILLVSSSATAATAAAEEQVRPSTVTALEPVSTSTAAAVTMTSNRKRKPAKGFHVVKELPRGAQAGLSPAKGELWLATTANDGSVQLDHLRAGRWTTETVPVDDWGEILLTGTSRDDVWLAVGASLRRYDGRRWTTVALPARDFGARPFRTTSVVSPRRGVLYVALSSAEWFVASRVFRYAQGRWTELGDPSLERGYHQVVQMKVVDGALLARAQNLTSEDFESYVGGKVTVLYSNWFLADTPFHISGWYPRSYSNHLLLGQGGFEGTAPMCQRWIGAEPLVDCATTRVISASAQLRNGTIVLAGTDRYRFVDPRTGTTQGEWVEGGFGLRFPDGREIPLAGGPGESTEFFVAEAHRNAAWAVTTTYTGTGYKYYLQRYDG